MPSYNRKNSKKALKKRNLKASDKKSIHEKKLSPKEEKLVGKVLSNRKLIMDFFDKLSGKKPFPGYNVPGQEEWVKKAFPPPPPLEDPIKAIKKAKKNILKKATSIRSIPGVKSAIKMFKKNGEDIEKAIAEMKKRAAAMGEKIKLDKLQFKLPKIPIAVMDGNILQANTIKWSVVGVRFEPVTPSKNERSYYDFSVIQNIWEKNSPVACDKIGGGKSKMQHTANFYVFDHKKLLTFGKNMAKKGKGLLNKGMGMMKDPLKAGTDLLKQGNDMAK